MTTSTIELKCQRSSMRSTSDTKAPYYSLVTELVVNGNVVGAHVEVDLIAILAYGEDPFLNFYPFTCDCGVPGCAGFHEPVLLSSKDGFIEWKLPIKYYVDVVPQGTYVDGDFFVLRFNKSAYLMALKNAKKQAQALLRQSVAEGAHLLLTQSGYPLSGYHLKALPRLVGSEVSRYRSHAQAFTAEQLGRMTLYGPTWDSAFVLTMANGVRLKAGLVSLFQSVIYAPDDSSAIEESRVIPLVTLAEKGPYELLEYLKTADNFEEWSSAFIPDGPTPEGFNLGSSLAKALKTGTPSIEAL